MARTRSLRNPAIGADALQLFGVISHDAAAPLRIPGVEMVQLRDLAAIVHTVPYERMAATTDAITEYRRVVEEAFRAQVVIPAPFGTVFRSRSSLLHWMELHYTTLMDATGDLTGRVMTRVRVAPLPMDAESMTETREGRVADFETTVFDSFRFLNRSAMGCVTFAPQNDGHARSVEASFLVDREKWGAFRDAVSEERERLPEMSIEHGAPLPPYDFVRLQFGA